MKRLVWILVVVGLLAGCVMVRADDVKVMVDPSGDTVFNVNTPTEILRIGPDVKGKRMVTFTFAGKVYQGYVPEAAPAPKK